MRRERQIELLERLAASGAHFEGMHAPHSMINPASAYTDPERYAKELRVLFRNGPTLLGLSCEMPEPGDYLSTTLDGIPVVAVRQADGSIVAMVNACRHRAAPLVDARAGKTGRSIVCNYHGWTYDTDGTLRARPLSAGAFDDVTMPCNLHRVAVAERYGLIFVRAGSTEPIDVDEALGGAQDDLGSFRLDTYTHIETRTNEWAMNWKLVLDTFTESYHIRWLHKNTIAPAFNSDCVISERFGRNCLSIGLRANVREELDKPKDEWSLIPYGTIQYFLVPNALVVHQLDHVEVWRLEPLGVGRVRTHTSIFAPEPPDERAMRYWTKNLDLLLQVTGTEDFPTMERIQAALASGAVPELVYGRIEPPLIHFHSALNEALAGA
ncbi:MAG: aromatic ring-hydroxylating dioxygenase subunit alpha, partial [Acidimicrobiia bacterium]